jgi:pyruvate kinase
VRDELCRPVAAILDTKGPEIRIKTFAGGQVALVPGAEFILTTDEAAGDEHRVSVTYDNLHAELYPGCRVLIDDGLIELKVKEIRGREILCVSGKTEVPFPNNKSHQHPGSTHPASRPHTESRDREDLRFAAEQGFDFVAASFVRTASDVEDIRRDAGTARRTGHPYHCQNRKPAGRG